MNHRWTEAAATDQRRAPPRPRINNIPVAPYGKGTYVRRYRVGDKLPDDYDAKVTFRNGLIVIFYFVAAPLLFFGCLIAAFPQILANLAPAVVML